MTQNLRLSRRGALALMTGGAALAGSAVAHSSVDPARFTHGVAAGDPMQDGFVIWTRAVGAGTTVGLCWEAAEDADFTRIVQSGMVQATAARDHTAKVDVTGLRAGDRTSVV
jgi:phosphodiesterase/alkaline phosphatase D-like protein